MCNGVENIAGKRELNYRSGVNPTVSCKGHLTIKEANLHNTPSSVPTEHLLSWGEVANFNAPSPLRESATCVSTGVKGKIGRGFTLIELLVVVLIIGILAAIALPQYQKAVWKSRSIEAKVFAVNLAKTQAIYRLTNGQYTQDFSKLDIQL